MISSSDHQALAQPNHSNNSPAPSYSTTSTKTTSAPQQAVQGVTTAVPSPPVTMPATSEEVDHLESNGGWIPDGSVPSPGVGHHP